MQKQLLLLWYRGGPPPRLVLGARKGARRWRGAVRRVGGRRGLVGVRGVGGGLESVETL